MSEECPYEVSVERLGYAVVVQFDPEETALLDDIRLFFDQETPPVYGGKKAGSLVFTSFAETASKARMEVTAKINEYLED